MGGGQGSIAAGCRLAGICALALAIGGCAVGIATSASVGSAFNAALLLGVASGAQVGGVAPGMNPERRVSEQSCNQPIEDSSANLKCR